MGLMDIAVLLLFGLLKGTSFYVYCGIRIAGYLVYSLSLMRLAKRHGVPAGVLAWLPVTRTGVLAELGGRLICSHGGKDRNWQAWLGILDFVCKILTGVLIVLVYEVMIHWMLVVLAMAFLNSDGSIVTGFQNATLTLLTNVLLVVWLVCVAARVVIRMRMYYRIFRAEKPEQANMLLTLCILLGIGPAVGLGLCAFNGKKAK